MTMNPLLYLGDALGAYGFPQGHPLGIDRQGAFWREAQARKLDRRVNIVQPVGARREEIERFHRPEYVERVIELSRLGSGYLDYGDTPAFAGMFEIAAHVVGSALDGLARIMRGEARRSFQPIGGLHHARRGAAAGFCVFNDPGVVIETLRNVYGVKRIAYVDIDVHHGDGVFYEFEADPDLIVVDIHQDGMTLYPGTGFADETGRGAAAGTKLNLPLKPGSRDRDFLAAWEQGERFLVQQRPQFFLLQCGADGLSGDPLANLQLTSAAHAHVARRLCALSDEFAQGRLMAFGGGGYDLSNLARAWSAVLEQLIST
jgi:acetoin utilization protein AcuC